MIKSAFIFAFILIAYGAAAGGPDFNVSLKALASSGNTLPIWLTANQNGAFTHDHHTYQLLTTGFARQLTTDRAKKWDYSYGTTFMAGQGDKYSYQLNEYWIGARYKHLLIKAGAKNEPVKYSGLSHTNGNMIWSGNARPLPGITFSTDGYLPVFRNKKWLTVKGLYEENFLLDRRDMTHAMLHHKNLYGKATINSWSLSFGLDHWVYWGGASRTQGKMPGLEYYPRYILGLKGGKNSSGSDRANAAGNSIGMYALEATKNLGGHLLTFYWNHPFEDRSGLEFDNMPDGVWGLHYLNKKSTALLTGFVYEYMNTLNQSGTYHLLPSGVPGVVTGRGRDNYFALGLGMSNGFYSSGHVHYNRMMGTPLFIPVIGADGISKGFDNTRIEMHHAGIGGSVTEQLTWSALLTWSQSRGTYEKPYAEVVEQFSGLAALDYQFRKMPLRIRAGMACDRGDRFEQRYGGMLGMNLKF